MMGNGFGPGGSFRLTGRREVVILHRKANAARARNTQELSIFNLVMDDEKII